MEPQQSHQLQFREIRPGDNVSGLSLGHAEYKPLKIFLKKNAKNFHDNNIAKTFVYVQNPDNGTPRVMAYITLICAEIEVDGKQKPDECASASKYKSYPAIKIARLAVDRTVERQGLGKKLVAFAVATAQSVMPKVGCRFLVVDSKPQAVSWYEKKAGFTLLDAERPKYRQLIRHIFSWMRKQEKPHPILFIDLHKLLGE